MIKLEQMEAKDRELAMAFDQDITQAMYDAVDTSNKLEMNLQKFEGIVLTVLVINAVSWYQTIGGVDKEEFMSAISHIYDGFDSDQTIIKH
jgi:hypothetical protein